MQGQVMECVPNFSVGNNKEILERIVQPFREAENVKLLDYSSDAAHNRSVVTVVGEPQALADAVVEAMGIAIQNIDMNKHQGEHPRMGAVDVVPFIPIKMCGMEDAVALAKQVAEIVAKKHNLPIFLYEKAASIPERENLAVLRKGQYEGMKKKLAQKEWKPDFGPSEPHATAGVTAIGARMPLIAYNINLATNDIQIADKIARCIRHISGGLRYCKAIGIDLADSGIVQVSINMTDYTKTSLYQAFEMVKFEARRYGVNVIGSEIIGLTPSEALLDVAAYYLGLNDFSMEQVLENKLME